MIVRVGNNIELEFNGIKRTVLFFEFSFQEVGDNVILYQNDKILFQVPKSDVDIEELTNINLIVGKDGENGKDGKDGRDGNNGLDGKDGKDGVDGDAGRDGRDGKDGIDGKDGKDGQDAEPFKPSEEFIQRLKGKDGKDGKNGRDGTNGIDGENGKNGENGTNGKNGSNGVDGVSFVWSGDYELGEDYEKNEVVEFFGSSYICVNDTDEPPLNEAKELSSNWDLMALKGRDGRNGRDGINAGATVPLFNKINFDVTNDTLPIASSSVDYLNVDFDNFNGDINLTGQLPTNLKKGARLILRKIDTKRGRIVYDDGIIFYNFVRKKGDYLELIWNGTIYII